ncbi:hypothetical protein [Candidatus Solirubrobacter pratensis]|uniref:hypothetical protein n=1 Tax=Candidatus Solirubrobacter pratensis TaxID=1298857 RepID=UPI0012DC19F2|nr:hypothetical protein [Candidatus Solirubrobacter pratensis]
MAVAGELRWRQGVLAGLLALLLGLGIAAVPAEAGARSGPKDRGSFHLEEASIADIQTAILRHQVTVTDVVTGYLARIKAYNGTCVDEPQGILGPITPIPHAGQINALMTLNLRPASRAAFGFDARKARSLTDSGDNAPGMPDALEVAATEDA